MSLGKKVVIGIVVFFLIVCGLMAWFVNWSNSDAGQAAFREVETQQAYASATAAVIETQNAYANATSTAVMALVDARIQNAQLVFEEDFSNEDSAFIKANAGDFDPFFKDGTAEMILPWNGSYTWALPNDFTDFVAEVECYTTNDAFCGVAYGIHKKEGNPERSYFYASGIGTADVYFFDDLTTGFSSSKYMRKNFADSPTDDFTHRVRVEKFGANMRLYVNGQLMDERVLESSDALTGKVGFYFGKATNESGIQTVTVSSFKVWELP